MAPVPRNPQDKIRISSAPTAAPDPPALAPQPQAALPTHARGPSPALKNKLTFVLTFT